MCGNPLHVQQNQPCVRKRNGLHQSLWKHAAESYRQPVTKHAPMPILFTAQAAMTRFDPTPQINPCLEVIQETGQIKAIFTSLLGIVHLQPILRYCGIFMRRSHVDRTALLCLCQPARVVAGAKQRGHRLGDLRTDG